MHITTQCVPTDDYYREIIAAPDLAARQRIYKDRFIAPWKPMMDMLKGGAFGATVDSDDDFAGARAWFWLLPEDLSEAPESLRKLESIQAWQVAGDALERAAASLEAYADRLPLDAVSGWLVLADPTRSDPMQKGVTGAGDFMQPRFVVQYDTPTERNLGMLPGMFAHEMHHLVRLRLFPWDMQATRVADYIVLEGTAEAFAESIAGSDNIGYYVTDFDEAELEIARKIIGAGLQQTGFNEIRSYIFGDYWAEKLNLPTFGVPTYGGYAMGFHVVKAFMQRTGCSAAEATFISADEIIAGSGFFD